MAEPASTEPRVEDDPSVDATAPDEPGAPASGNEELENQRAALEALRESSEKQRFRAALAEYSAAVLAAIAR